jgi:hypothetical protein
VNGIVMAGASGVLALAASAGCAAGASASPQLTYACDALDSPWSPPSIGGNEANPLNVIQLTVSNNGSSPVSIPNLTILLQTDTENQLGQGTGDRVTFNPDAANVYDVTSVYQDSLPGNTQQQFALVIPARNANTAFCTARAG